MNFVIGAGVLIFAIFLIVLGVSEVFKAVVIDTVAEIIEKKKAKEEQEQEEPFFKDGRQK